MHARRTNLTRSVAVTLRHAINHGTFVSLQMFLILSLTFKHAVELHSTVRSTRTSSDYFYLCNVLVKMEGKTVR